MKQKEELFKFYPVSKSKEKSKGLVKKRSLLRNIWSLIGYRAFSDALLAEFKLRHQTKNWIFHVDLKHVFHSKHQMSIMTHLIN